MSRRRQVRPLDWILWSFLIFSKGMYIYVIGSIINFFISFLESGTSGHIFLDFIKVCYFDEIV